MKESFQENLTDILTNKNIHDMCSEIENNSTDINQIVSSFTEMLKCAGKKFEKQPKRYKRSQPKWFDESCYVHKRLKYQLLRQYRQNKNGYNLQVINCKKRIQKYV